MEMPKSHDEWLALRLKGIGGSEAAAVIGQSPWCSNVELWKRKTGRVTAPDISNNQAVQYGHDAEPLLRGLFALDYAGRYRTEYISEFDMVHHPEHPYIFATLDGRLTELETGRKGVLEIKTTSILRSMQKEQWWQDGSPASRNSIIAKFYTNYSQPAGILQYSTPNSNMSMATTPRISAVSAAPIP